MHTGFFLVQTEGNRFLGKHRCVWGIVLKVPENEDWTGGSGGQL
jgi:hypothetical protein